MSVYKSTFIFNKDLIELNSLVATSKIKYIWIYLLTKSDALVAENVKKQVIQPKVDFRHVVEFDWGAN